jgi:transposase
MRPKGGSAVLEMRRRLAVRMLRTGQTPSAVCKLLGVGRVTLWRWRTAKSLAAAPSRGARSRLSHSQRRRLTRLLERDPTEHGWPTSLWTSGRVADLIRRRFGVRYHPAHVWRLLRAMGLSKQKPQSPRRERDEAAVARWRRYRWPAIKKRRGASSDGSSSSTSPASCSSPTADGPGP